MHTHLQFDFPAGSYDRATGKNCQFCESPESDDDGMSQTHNKASVETPGTGFQQDFCFLIE